MEMSTAGFKSRERRNGGEKRIEEKKRRISSERYDERSLEGKTKIYFSNSSIYHRASANVNSSNYQRASPSFFFTFFLCSIIKDSVSTMSVVFAVCTKR